MLKKDSKASGSFVTLEPQSLFDLQVLSCNLEILDVTRTRKSAGTLSASFQRFYEADQEGFWERRRSLRILRY